MHVWAHGSVNINLSRQCNGPYCRLFASHDLGKSGITDKSSVFRGAGLKGRILETRKGLGGSTGVLRGVNRLVVIGFTVDARVSSDWM